MLLEFLVQRSQVIITIQCKYSNLFICSILKQQNKMYWTVERLEEQQTSHMTTRETAQEAEEKWWVLVQLIVCLTNKRRAEETKECALSISKQDTQCSETDRWEKCRTWKLSNIEFSVKATLLHILCLATELRICWPHKGEEWRAVPRQTRDEKWKRKDSSSIPVHWLQLTRSSISWAICWSGPLCWDLQNGF